MRKLMALAATAALSITAAPAIAQNAGLIVVDLAVNNVANNIARDLDVNVSQIPVTVQVPIGIAANVCNVSAAVLAQQSKRGNAECDATSNSKALNKIVQRQMNRQ